MKVFCPCCGYKTLSEERIWEICPICFWEDDPVQYEDPFYEGGANHISLYRAKENYETIGACEECFLSNVRNPIVFPERDPSWKSFKVLVSDYYRERIDTIDDEIGLCLVSEDIDEQARLKYIINALDVIDPLRARILSLKIVSMEHMCLLWRYAYKYLSKYHDEEIENLFIRFSIDNGAMYPEINGVINEYFRDGV